MTERKLIKEGWNVRELTEILQTRRGCLLRPQGSLNRK